MDVTALVHGDMILKYRNNFAAIAMVAICAAGCWIDVTKDPQSGFGEFAGTCIQLDHVVFLTLLRSKADYGMAIARGNIVPASEDEYYGEAPGSLNRTEIVGMLPVGTRIRADRFLKTDNPMSAMPRVAIFTILDGEFRGKTFEPRIIVHESLTGGNRWTVNQAFAHPCTCPTQ